MSLSSSNNCKKTITSCSCSSKKNQEHKTSIKSGDFKKNVCEGCDKNCKLTCHNREKNTDTEPT